MVSTPLLLNRNFAMGKRAIHEGFAPIKWASGYRQEAFGLSPATDMWLAGGPKGHRRLPTKPGDLVEAVQGN